MRDPNQQPRVLVIDDRANIADLLCSLLELLGCVTDVAYNGADGIAEAARFEPHLAFIDYEMPGMDGCQVARHLRAIHPKGSLRLICLTGRGHPDDRSTCLAAGFDEFFTKPMPQESLEEVVAALNAVL